MLPECLEPKEVSTLSALCSKLVLVTTSRSEREQLEQQFAGQQVLWLETPFRQTKLLELLGLAPSEAVSTAFEPDKTAVVAGLSVLVVEDNPLSQRIMVLQLNKIGCIAHGVGTSAEAISAIVSGEYDLVLMDWWLPDLDGLATTRQIRKLDRISGRHTPIIAMTGNAMPGDRERCLEAGMDDYMVKPASRKTLAAMIDRWHRYLRMGA